MSETHEKAALLLDDNLMTAMRVQKQLERAGYVVRTSGALPQQTEATPEIVLINLGSRSLRGVDLIAKCKAQFPDATVSGFCGHTEIEIRQAAKSAGVKRIFTNDEAMTELAGLLSVSQ
jgi:DNA-binding NarL/FixJ family response regulator